MPESNHPTSSHIRAFIAIDVSADIRNQIANLTRQLKTRIPSDLIRWNPPEKSHLTLRFLGDSTADQIARMKNDLSLICSAHPHMPVACKSCGAFPNLNRPRVIWMGLEISRELYDLQREIEELARRHKYTAETKPFNPHLTLARINDHIQPQQIAVISQALQPFIGMQFGEMLIQQLHLYRSDQQPDGHFRYSIIKTFPLSTA